MWDYDICRLTTAVYAMILFAETTRLRLQATPASMLIMIPCGVSFRPTAVYFSAISRK
jgi:hypothetical protein